MGASLNPSEVAQGFHRQMREEITRLKAQIRLVGLLTQEAGPSRTYAEYTRAGCEAVGVTFELRQVDRFHLESELFKANADPAVHGVLIYYPVFGTGQDSYFKDLIDWRKDVEGLSNFWIRKLYANERSVPGVREPVKAIVPCTPLAIIKMLGAAGALTESQARPAAGRIVTIFNRSEVVGRPLATMLSNDGATVYSFDVDGAVRFELGAMYEDDIRREDALGKSDIVITGVPSKSFPPIRADEIRHEAACLNFSTTRNFTPEAEQKARLYIPRVGPVTVAMCLRNTIRLFRGFHQGA